MTIKATPQEVELLKDVSTFQDYEDDLFKYFNGEKQNNGLYTDWQKLNNFYRPALGTLNIITGIPSHGKSSFVDALAVSLSINHEIKWAMFSPENYPTYLHIQKIMELWVGKPFFSEFAMNKDEFMETYKKCSNYFTFLTPTEQNLNLTHILEMAQFSIEADNTTGIVIDPWNEIIHEKEDGQNESDYIGQSLSLCRRFARKYNVLFFILAHPAKMYKDPKEKCYDVPTLYNISGSANWYNRADNGITIYRNFDNEKKDNESVDVFIQKIKFKSQGKIGVVRMKYDFLSGRFSEMIENIDCEKTRFDF
jgi:twinkle protein